MGWLAKVRALISGPPTYDVAGRGRRSVVWMPGNRGAIAALLLSGHELRVKSRDLVRRNAWAAAALEAFVANAVRHRHQAAVDGPG